MEHPHWCISHKDLKNLQSQPTHFHEYVYWIATSFDTSLGHYQVGIKMFPESIHISLNTELKQTIGQLVDS